MNAPITIVIPETPTGKDRAKLNGVVRISPEAELALLRLSGESGLSMRNVASQLIEQAAQICAIERR